MVELYITWIKDLPYDKEALDILKNSSIDGVEMRNTDEQLYNILDNELKLSLHNPIAYSTKGLEDPDFRYKFYFNKGITEGSLSSNAPILGFHTGYSFIFDRKMSISEVKTNTVDNLNDLDEIFNKKIVFELPSFHQDYIGKENQEYMDSITNPVFIKDILSKSDAGFLFDISHMFISGKTKESILRLNQKILDNITSYLEGKPINKIN